MSDILTLDRAAFSKRIEKVLSIPSAGYAPACDLADTIFDAIESELRKTVAAPSFQLRVLPWMLTCFGPAIPYDKIERGDRLLEEVLELLQSGNYPKQRIAALVEYVYSRDVGEPKQEVGGVMVTLAAYCLAHNVDMHEAAETELARVWTKVEQIRAKQASKPTGSALPVAVDSGPSQQELAAIGQSVMNWIDELTQQEGPLKDWTPAESPAEIIPDLYNMLDESFACHRQACGETKALAAEMERRNEPAEHVTLADYATRLFDLHGFMLLETYRDKPAVTVTFPDLKEAQQFHNTLVELSTHRPRPRSLLEGLDNG
ncbi:hypothetical protein [Rhizobium ruizarguesonis]|uniref:hypothetical protein n=1 Tax=Rhizobium ruizarguesonis TaxID=2081791 RepID=UPI001FE1C00C|nr:hypothetical protein [Rhizobium ruizarguesonis]